VGKEVGVGAGRGNEYGFWDYGGYPGRYYTVLRNTPVIPEIFGVKIESVAVKNGSPKQG
jgi:hypothetical protein